MPARKATVFYINGFSPKTANDSFCPCYKTGVTFIVNEYSDDPTRALESLKGPTAHLGFTAIMIQLVPLGCTLYSANVISSLASEIPLLIEVTC